MGWPSELAARIRDAARWPVHSSKADADDARGALVTAIVTNLAALALR